MNDRKNPKDPSPEAPPAGPGKRPYMKPAFRHEQVFETMALACGKTSATQASCRTNRRNS